MCDTLKSNPLRSDEFSAERELIEALPPFLSVGAGPVGTSVLPGNYDGIAGVRTARWVWVVG